MQEAILLLTILSAIIVFVMGFRYGRKKDLMGPTYPSQLSGIFVGCLFSGLIILLSLAIYWLFYAKG